MSDDDKEPLRRIAPGDVLADKYRVERVLGVGGMGQVLLAVHVGLDQKVAVKALLPNLAKSSEAVTRFTREAKALAKLQSEHVARVFDVGALDSGLPYMVMEYLDGSDLADIVDTRGPMPIHEAVELALQICAGLAEVHASGIIHRDLKPSNIYVVTRGDGSLCAKLLDFGISKFEGATITRTAAILGSPGYMSPEQMRSTKSVDERTDVWALGAIVYEMLTAVPAFVAENAPALCAKIADEDPAPPRTLRADIPAELEEFVLTCLQKDPTKRYGTVAEVARALAPFAPARALPYVAKVEDLLGDAKAGIRDARAEGKHERPTVPATPSSARMKAGRAASHVQTALAETSHASMLDAPAAKAPAPRAGAPRRQAGLAVFVLGSILGAGVAIAYLGDVQKIRAQIAAHAGGIELPTSTPGSPSTDAPKTPGSASTAAPVPSSAPSANLDAALGATPAASTAAPSALDASIDAGLEDDDAGDEEEDDASSATTDAAVPTVHPAAPAKRKPVPARPPRKRPRRR